MERKEFKFKETAVEFESTKEGVMVNATQMASFFGNILGFSWEMKVLKI